MKRVLAAVILIVLLAGCGQPVVTVTPAPALALIETSVGESATVIQAEMGKAIPKIEAVKTEKPDVRLDEAKASCVVVQGEGVKLAKVTVPQIADAEKALMAITKERDAAQAAQKKAAADLADLKANQFRNFLFWVQVVGLIILGLGIVAIFIAGSPTFLWLDRTLGFYMVGGGIVVLGLAYFVNMYIVEIAWGAVVLVAGTLGYFGYKAWREHQNFVQSAKVTEAARQVLTPEQDATVFGVGAIPGIVGTIVDDKQSAAVTSLRASGILKTST